jgi:catechol 2,3-dioxygenase-like lactoylglutathione lyase family enzyme
MELSIQAVLVSVSDLERSIKFYREVFDLRLVSQGDRVAALLINEMARSQVLALREVGPVSARAGGTSGCGCSRSRLVRSTSST